MVRGKGLKYDSFMLTGRCRPITGRGFCASAYCNWKGEGDEGGLMSSSLQNPRTNLLSVKAVSQ